MGFLESIEKMAQQGTEGQGVGSQSTETSVVGGMMQALDEHPGGLSGVLAHLQQNGMGEEAQGWAQGQPATPQQVQQGLNGSGFIENVAAKAGVSPEVAKVAMATLLPLVISHFTQGGQTAPPQQGGFGGMAGQILGRLV